jgi:hypothetical protein
VRTRTVSSLGAPKYLRETKSASFAPHAASGERQAWYDFTMRRAAPLLLGVTAVTAVACGSAMELDVGSNAQTAAPAPDASVAPRSFGTTQPASITRRLEQLCANPHGPASDYLNAAELTQHVRGRWYHCGSIGNWALPPGTGLEFTFGATGAYAFLSLCEAPTCVGLTKDGFVASTDPDQSGQVLYLAFNGTTTFDAGPEGGTSEGGASDAAASGGDLFVPVDDTTPRNGIFLYMTRADTSDFEFQVTFEENPRRMTLRELGGDPVLAEFVPID